MALYGVPTFKVENYWPLVAPLVSEALATTQGVYEPADVLVGLKSGDMQLWVIGDPPTSCAVTRILIYPRSKSCDVFLTAGALDEITEAIRGLCIWARAEGAAFMEAGGRYGWSRVLQRQGWTESFRHMTKDLTNA